MSQGKSCRCPRAGVVVLTRNANYSAFNGYHYTPSDYSAVMCTCCGACWRTKSAWVAKAPDMSKEQLTEWMSGAGSARPRCTHKQEHAT